MPPATPARRSPASSATAARRPGRCGSCPPGSGYAPPMGGADANDLWRTLLAQEHASSDSLLPPGATVVDAHTHLGHDIDGRSLALADHLDGMARYDVACSYVFALNEPDREPAYRAPNDRILR